MGSLVFGIDSVSLSSCLPLSASQMIRQYARRSSLLEFKFVIDTQDVMIIGIRVHDDEQFNLYSVWSAGQGDLFTWPNWRVINLIKFGASCVEDSWDWSFSWIGSENFTNLSFVFRTGKRKWSFPGIGSGSFTIIGCRFNWNWFVCTLIWIGSGNATANSSMWVGPQRFACGHLDSFSSFLIGLCTVCLYYSLLLMLFHSLFLVLISQCII